MRRNALGKQGKAAFVYLASSEMSHTTKMDRFHSSLPASQQCSGLAFMYFASFFSQGQWFSIVPNPAFRLAKGVKNCMFSFYFYFSLSFFFLVVFNTFISSTQCMCWASRDNFPKEFPKVQHFMECVVDPSFCASLKDAVAKKWTLNQIKEINNWRPLAW